MTELQLHLFGFLPVQRIYHPYTDWEDYKAGMWRLEPSEHRQEWLEKAIAFTGDAKLYGTYMLRVVSVWPIACEQNLSNPLINRRAWVGHAACCLAINCPEDITREAWGMLTEQQRIDANAQADLAIAEWERNRP